SLSYLAQLHVDAIKLDRSFTRALHEEGAGDSIAPQVVAMAKSLGLTLVVEGIEKNEQAAYYLALDDRALSQGWLFGRPLAAQDLFGAR
ncbi:MAG: EAL domain-containing protein, partial [Burkholderiaceae bacterium]